jgi:hypothetical protein
MVYPLISTNRQMKPSDNIIGRSNLRVPYGPYSHSTLEFELVRSNQVGQASALGWACSAILGTLLSPTRWNWCPKTNKEGLVGELHMRAYSILASVLR